MGLRKAVSALVLMCLLSTGAFAQLFPNAPWNSQSKYSSSCPGGKCPTNATTANTSPGHWSYPGSIDSHLEGTHGVATAGMSFAQKRNLHDSLHESPMSDQFRQYPAVSKSATYGSAGSSVRGYGSSGSYFGRDYDGAVITSVGPALAPPLPQAAAASEVSVLKIGDRMAFRRALIDAARKARDCGDITSLEFFLLSAASRNSRTLEKIQQAVHEAAIEEGLATTQSIDWDALIEFIEKLIPIIIKLIDLFSMSQPMQSFDFVPVQQYAYSPPLQDCFASAV